MNPFPDIFLLSQSGGRYLDPMLPQKYNVDLTRAPLSACLDYCVSTPKIPELSDLKSVVVTDVAGFLVNMTKWTIKCETYLTALVTNEVSEQQSLLKQKKRGNRTRH